jgi:hypothetical protein
MTWPGDGAAYRSSDGRNEVDFIGNQPIATHAANLIHMLEMLNIPEPTGEFS